MVRNKRILFVISILILVSLACGTTSSGNTSASSGDQNATAIALGVEATRNANMKATMESASFASTASAMGAAAQPAPTQPPVPATATVAPPTIAPPPTQEVIVQPTLDVGAEATALAQPMYDELQELLEDSAIRSIEGAYYPVEDFQQVWYDPKTYTTWRSGHSASNFVIRADMQWRANEPSADFAQSGCGFVYGETDMDHYHATILAPDGVVHTYRSRGSEKIEMKGGRYYGAMGVSSGEAEIMLVMENKTMAFFVNGIETVRFKDPYFQLGNIGMTVLSGSYKGFQCTMTNIGFWELE